MSLDAFSNAFLLAAIICLAAIMFVYWLLKSHKIEDMITNSIENVIRDVSEDVELQKKLYQLGGLLGNGVKSGIGLQTRGGKFKLDDLAMSLAAKFLGLGENQDQQASNKSSTVL